MTDDHCAIITEATGLNIFTPEIKTFKDPKILTQKQNYDLNKSKTVITETFNNSCFYLFVTAAAVVVVIIIDIVVIIAELKVSCAH